MGILSGILGSDYAGAPRTVNRSAFASAEGDQALAEITQANIAIDQATSGLDRLLGAAAAVAAVNPTSKDAIQMARIHLAEAISSLDGDEDVALRVTAGLEDDTIENVGNEAWSSVKDFVNSIIDWIKKQWKKLKAAVAKYWNKYFGDVERLQKAWTKVQEEAKSKQTGFTLEKNSKKDYEKSADYFYADGILAGEKLGDNVEQFTDLLKAYAVKVDSANDIEFNESDIIASTGELAGDYEGDPKDPKVDEALLGKHTVAFTYNATKHAPAVKYGIKATKVLVGRCQAVVCINEETKEWPEFVKSQRVFVGNVAKDAKAEKKASMKFIEASDVEALATTHMEMLEEAVALKRHKNIAKAEDDLDKATKELESWKKNIPDDKDDSNNAAKRAAFRTGVKIATELFSLQRRLLVTTPVELCGAARLASSAHLEYAKDCLRAHKKD